MRENGREQREAASIGPPQSSEEADQRGTGICEELRKLERKSQWAWLFVFICRVPEAVCLLSRPTSTS